MLQVDNPVNYRITSAAFSQIPLFLEKKRQTAKRFAIVGDGGTISRMSGKRRTKRECSGPIEPAYESEGWRF
ncbi:MAG: hypothetical protein KDA44_16005, partial [Planctomycetales bacterium]|nr:hypothetical protein [Planctomycetales bacterium]